MYWEQIDENGEVLQFTAIMFSFDGTYDKPIGIYSFESTLSNESKGKVIYRLGVPDGLGNIFYDTMNVIVQNSTTFTPIYITDSIVGVAGVELREGKWIKDSVIFAFRFNENVTGFDKEL